MPTAWPQVPTEDKYIPSQPRPSNAPATTKYDPVLLYSRPGSRVASRSTSPTPADGLRSGGLSPQNTGGSTTGIHFPSPMIRNMPSISSLTSQHISSHGTRDSPLLPAVPPLPPLPTFAAAATTSGRPQPPPKPYQTYPPAHKELPCVASAEMERLREMAEVKSIASSPDPIASSPGPITCPVAAAAPPLTAMTPNRASQLRPSAPSFRPSTPTDTGPTYPPTRVFSSGATHPGQQPYSPHTPSVGFYPDWLPAADSELLQGGSPPQTSGFQSFTSPFSPSQQAQQKEISSPSLDAAATAPAIYHRPGAAKEVLSSTVNVPATADSTPRPSKIVAVSTASTATPTQTIGTRASGLQSRLHSEVENVKDIHRGGGEILQDSLLPQAQPSSPAFSARPSPEGPRLSRIPGLGGQSKAASTVSLSPPEAFVSRPPSTQPPVPPKRRYGTFIPEGIPLKRSNSPSPSIASLSSISSISTLPSPPRSKTAGMTNLEFLQMIANKKRRNAAIKEADTVSPVASPSTIMSQDDVGHVSCGPPTVYPMANSFSMVTSAEGSKPVPLTSLPPPTPPKREALLPSIPTPTSSTPLASSRRQVSPRPPTAPVPLRAQLAPTPSDYETPSQGGAGSRREQVTEPPGISTNDMAQVNPLATTPPTQNPQTADDKGTDHAGDESEDSDKQDSASPAWIRPLELASKATSSTPRKAISWSPRATPKSTVRDRGTMSDHRTKLPSISIISNPLTFVTTNASPVRTPKTSRPTSMISLDKGSRKALEEIQRVQDFPMGVPTSGGEQNLASLVPAGLSSANKKPTTLLQHVKKDNIIRERVVSAPGRHHKIPTLNPNAKPFVVRGHALQAATIPTFTNPNLTTNLKAPTSLAPPYVVPIPGKLPCTPVNSPMVTLVKKASSSTKAAGDVFEPPGGIPVPISSSGSVVSEDHDLSSFQVLGTESDPFEFVDQLSHPNRSIGADAVGTNLEPLGDPLALDGFRLLGRQVEFNDKGNGSKKRTKRYHVKEVSEAKKDSAQGQKHTSQNPPSNESQPFNTPVPPTHENQLRASLDTYRLLATGASGILQGTTLHNALDAFRVTAELQAGYNSMVANQLKLVDLLNKGGADDDPIYEMLTHALEANGEHLNSLHETLSLINHLRNQDVETAWAQHGGRPEEVESDV